VHLKFNGKALLVLNVTQVFGDYKGGIFHIVQ